MSQQQQQQEEQRRREEEDARLLAESLAQSAYNDYWNNRERIAKETRDDSAWIYGAADRPVHERTNTKEKAK